MQVLSFLLCATFYASLYGKALLMKLNGIQANLMMKPEGKEKDIRIAEIFVSLGSFGMATAQFISIFFYDHLSKFSVQSEVTAIGIFLQILGISLLMISMYTMRDSWRQGVSLKQNTEFVSNGIYKYSRNPAFVGFDLFYIGNALHVSTYIQFCMLIFTIITFHFQILAEEKSLAVMFGEKYKIYCKKTPRYLIF